MTTLYQQDKTENLEPEDEQKESAEANHEKTARVERQKSYIQIMAGGVFHDGDLKGMLDHAEKCSAKEFQAMLIGDAGKGVPPISEIIMQEKLWQMALVEEEKKHPGLKTKLVGKIAAESGANLPTDRRILLAEAVWELEYVGMEAIMPANLLPDLKRYYGKYDRSRAAEKHKIAARDQLIPDCDKVADRMKQGIVKRIQLEYKMLTNEHFPKNTVKLWSEHIDKIKTPEEAILELKKLTGEAEGREGYVQKEEKFNARRSELQKKNPAAYDYFLRLYNSETQEKLFATRDKVMDEAIANVDIAFKELSKLTTDSQPPDKSEFQTIEEITARIESLDGDATKVKTKTTDTVQMDEAALKRLIDGAKEEAILTDDEVRNLLLERKIVEAKKNEMRLRGGKSEERLSEQRREQLGRINDVSAKEKAKKGEGESEQREIFTKTDERESLLVIGEDGLGIKEKDDQRRIASILNDMSEDQLTHDGLALGRIVDQKGEEILDETGLRAKQDILDAKLDQALGTKIREKAISSGLEAGKATEISTRNLRKGRLEDTRTAIDSML